MRRPTVLRADGDRLCAGRRRGGLDGRGAWQGAIRPGGERLADALRRRGARNAAETIGVGPILLGGFAFGPSPRVGPGWEGYPDGRLVLPRYLLTSVDGATWLTINAVLGPAIRQAAVLGAVAGLSALLAGAERARRRSRPTRLQVRGSAPGGRSRGDSGRRRAGEIRAAAIGKGGAGAGGPSAVPAADSTRSQR